MSISAKLGYVFIAPALILVVLFFLSPVILTGVFSFTNMSTATGITGGAYKLTTTVIRDLSEKGISKNTLKTIGSENYSISVDNLNSIKDKNINLALISELEQEHLGKIFNSRRNFERFLKKLNNRPRNIRDLKKVSKQFKSSLINRRFESKDEFIKSLEKLELKLNESEVAIIVEESYTGWVWTSENFHKMIILPETKQILINTGIYVTLTLFLFNTGFALILSISTFYLPKFQASIFRALWFLPRITPSVLYVLLWKWLTWDTGFMNAFLSYFGVQQRNWMLDTTINAWIFIILINGFIGASMGMIIFSSAITSIPKQILFASEVDGASRLQQIIHIILPQLKWPILFVLTYQCLSLLTSFEQILLSTDGGPGSTTEVWALSAYHNALNNYWGNLQYGYGAALALVLVAIGVIMSFTFLKIFHFNDLIKQPRIEQ